jgi:hypothetical protein
VQSGAIRRRGDGRVIGRWRADISSIAVETDDPELRRASDEILRTPQRIPVHGAEHFEFVTQAEPVLDAPSTVKYLALFALELEERGFVVEPDEE